MWGEKIIAKSVYGITISNVDPHALRVVRAIPHVLSFITKMVKIRILRSARQLQMGIARTKYCARSQNAFRCV